jgi:N-acetylglucosamine malate deacetylase 2
LSNRRQSEEGEMRGGISVDGADYATGWTRANDCVIVAAHPDDETVGAAWLLQRVPQCTIVHLTDGAPIDPGQAPLEARRSREAYALLRRREAVEAMSVVRIPPDRVRCLGAVDQEATFALTALTLALVHVLDEVRPSLVAVHAYEGGHPDHDAASFIAHAACAMIRQRGAKAPVIVEMTSYHAAGGRLTIGQFVPGSGPPEVVVRLSQKERARKSEMMACFGSQSPVLANFGVDMERFRLSPSYDFTRPPHAGALHYERLGWRLSGRDWRLFALGALRELGLGGMAWAAPS